MAWAGAGILTIMTTNQKGIKAVAGSIHTKATNAPVIIAGALRKIVSEAGIARSMNRVRERNSYRCRKKTGRREGRRPRAEAWPALLQALVLRLLQKASEGGTRAAAVSIPMMVTDACAKARRAINQNAGEAVAAMSIGLFRKAGSSGDRT